MENKIKTFLHVNTLSLNGKENKNDNENNLHPLHPLNLLNFLNNLTVENEFELSEQFELRERKG